MTILGRTVHLASSVVFLGHHFSIIFIDAPRLKNGKDFKYWHGKLCYFDFYVENPYFLQKIADFCTK